MPIQHDQLTMQPQVQQIRTTEQTEQVQQNQNQQLMEPGQQLTEQRESLARIQMPDTATLHIQNKEEQRRKAIEGRNIAPLLLLQEKSGSDGDSALMSEAKQRVQNLEKLLSETPSLAKLGEYMDLLEMAYMMAIAACQNYCDNRDPTFKTGKERKKAVEDELASLQDEQKKLAAARQLLKEGKLSQEITDGTALLTAGQQALLAEKRDENVQNDIRLEQTPMQKLTFEDFARMIGTHNRGQIQFDGKGLRIINNGKFSLSKGAASADNYDLAVQLQNVVLEKLRAAQIPVDRDMMTLLQKKLGLLGGNTLRPISRLVLGEIVSMVNDLTSQVDKTLREGRDAAPADHRLAMAVDEVLSGSRQEETRAATKEAHEEKLRRQVQTILSEARAQGVKVEELSKHQMDNLVKGNSNLIRNQVFESMQKIFRMMCSLNGGESVDFNLLAADKKLLSRISALTIARFSAVSPAGVMVAEHELGKCMTEAAFRYGKKQELLQDVEKSHVPLFATDGDQGLTGLVEKRLPEHMEWSAGRALVTLDAMFSNVSTARAEDWRVDARNVKKGMDGLRDLSNGLKELSELEQKAVTFGLEPEEADRLKLLGTRIQTLLTGQDESLPSPDHMELVANMLKGTRFAAGYEEVKKLVGEQNFSFAEAAGRIADATTIQKKREEEKSPLQQFREKLSKEAADDDRINRQAKIDDSNALLDKLTGKARDVAGMLLLNKEPSELIRKGDTETVQNILTLHKLIRSYRSGGARAQDIRLAGVNVLFTQRQSGMLEMQIDRQRIPIPHPLGALEFHLSSDITSHVDTYGVGAAKEVLSGGIADVSEDPKQYMEHPSRSLFINVLEAKTKLTATYFDNIPTEILRDFSMGLLENRLDEAGIRETVNSMVNNDKVQINDNEQDTMEMLRVLEKEKKARLEKKVVMPKAEVQKEEKQDQVLWTPEEAQIKELFAEMLYSKETWEEDGALSEPKERYRKLFHSNSGLIAKLVFKPEILDDMLKKFQFPGGDDMTETLKLQLKELFESEEMQELKSSMNQATLQMALNVLLGEKLGETQINGLATSVGWLNGWTAEQKEDFKNLLREKRALMLEKLDGIDETINGQVREQVAQMQEAINNSVSTVFDTKDEYRPQPKTLAGIMQEAARGKEGQGKFMKTILTNYFKDASPMDQRAMMASAIRELKPLQVKEGQPVDEKTKEAQQGTFLGGFLKGAGPLLHKILQGMPVDALPQVMKDALEDVRSNLSPIAPKVVESRLNKMVNESGGAITKIEVVGSMGAASIGQVLSCKLYGPGLAKDGKDVVVKLLRPEVHNRMQREKAKMLEYAQSVSEGMKITYEGQLQRIEEEMDFRIEARNLKLGDVYNRGSKTVQSMKLSNLVKPAVNTLVLEKAPGTNAAKYIKQVDDERKMIMEEFGRNRRKDTGYDATAKLNQLLEGMKKRQVYVTELAKKWVAEGIYDHGFYHGDLHAGNMMLSDEGLTVLDFGNATQLTEDQQKQIMHMVAAAATGNLEGFRHGFHMLLSKESQNTYDQKREELSELFTNILAMGSESDAGLRIAVALMKAQELGLELPAPVYNFSQCQIRLQNTIDEMNRLINEIKSNMVATIENRPAEKEDDLLAPLKDRVLENIVEKSQWRADKTKKKPEAFRTMLEREFSETYGLKREGFAEHMAKSRDTGIIYEVNDTLKNLNMFFDAFGLLEGLDSNSQNYQAIRPSLIRDLEGALSVFTKLCQEEAPEQIGQHREKAEQLKQMMNAPGVQLTEIRQAMTDFIHLSKGASADAVIRKMNVYMNLKKPEQEQLQQAEDDLYQSASELFEKHRFKVVYAAVLTEDEAAIRKLRPWFDDEQNYGGELLQHYQACREAKAAGNREQMEASARELINVLKKAIFQRFLKLDQMEDAQNATVPETFFDVMGTVIGQRKMASIWRLGPKGIYRYQIKPALFGTAKKQEMSKKAAADARRTLGNINNALDFMKMSYDLLEKKDDTVNSEETQKAFFKNYLHKVSDFPDVNSDEEDEKAYGGMAVSAKECLSYIPAASKAIKQSLISSWSRRLDEIADNQDLDQLKGLMDEMKSFCTDLKERAGIQPPNNPEGKTS